MRFDYLLQAVDDFTRDNNQVISYDLRVLDAVSEFGEVMEVAFSSKGVDGAKLHDELGDLLFSTLALAQLGGIEAPNGQKGHEIVGGTMSDLHRYLAAMAKPLGLLAKAHLNKTDYGKKDGDLDLENVRNNFRVLLSLLDSTSSCIGSDTTKLLQGALNKYTLRLARP